MILPFMRRLLILSVPALLAPACALASGGYWWTNDRDRNPTKGGWVSDGAYVEEYVFIAPSARVEESASITGDARIYGNAIVRGQASVGDRARVYGNAIVEGNAVIANRAQVFDHAIVGGETHVGGDARVGGYARLKTGQLESGLHRPPRPSAEIEAEQRSQAQRQHQMLYVRLDQAINELNRDWNHTGRSAFGGSTRTTFQIRLERRGDQLRVNVRRDELTREEGSQTGLDFRYQGSVALAGLLPGAPAQSRETQSYEMRLRLPAGTPGLTYESENLLNAHRSRKTSPNQRQFPLYARSAAPLEAFAAALKAVQAASPP